MNIAYDILNRRFVAEFSTDFAGDLAAVKAAGFKTDGPPQWVWATSKIPVVNKLRDNKPASGLTITDQAYNFYVQQKDMEEKNAAVKAQAAEMVKKAKKDRKDKQQEELTTTLVNIPEGQWSIGVEDLSPNSYVVKNIRRPLKLEGPACVCCGDPVAFYELQNPPTCLFCEIKCDKGLTKA